MSPLPQTRNGLESEGYSYTGEGRCRACGTPLLWFQTPNRDENGKFRKCPFHIEAGTEDHEERVLIPHWGKCPNAGDFRRKKK